jgi:hypothetical protein
VCVIKKSMYKGVYSLSLKLILLFDKLIWTIYKIKCSKNIQGLKTQANFRVWEIWKSLFCHAVAIKKELTIAFIHSFHVLPMCSVFQTCQTTAASSIVWLLWKLVISRNIRNTLSVWRSGLLVYNVIFIVGPNRPDTVVTNTMTKRKRTNKDLQNTTQKTKDRATRAQSKPGVNSGVPES